MDRKEQKSIIEGLLFVSGDEGIYPEQIAKVLEIEMNEAINILEEMQQECEGAKPWFANCTVCKSISFCYKERTCFILSKLIDTPTAASLSQAALETLAIVVISPTNHKD